LIKLNGKPFAETEKEFSPETGLVGYLQRFKRQIKLFNKVHQLIGVVNCHGVLCCATKLDTGKYWYSYADITEIGEWQSYMDQVDTLKSLSTGWDQLGYLYKA